MLSSGRWQSWDDVPDVKHVVSVKLLGRSRVVCHQVFWRLICVDAIVSVWSGTE